MRHDAAYGAAVFAQLEVGTDFVRHLAQFILQGLGVAHIGQLAIEMLADEVGGAAGDIYILTDQVAIDASNEVVGIEVQVFDVGVELRSEEHTSELQSLMPNSYAVFCLKK